MASTTAFLIESEPSRRIWEQPIGSREHRRAGVELEIERGAKVVAEVDHKLPQEVTTATFVESIHWTSWFQVAHGVAGAGASRTGGGHGCTFTMLYEDEIVERIAMSAIIQRAGN